MEREIKIRRVDFYPTDWLEGTISLTHVERSVFITICAAIYAHGGPVEISHVLRLCPGPGFDKALRSLIGRGKVRTSEGLLYQDRAEKEVSRARDRIETARINGTRGGRKNKGLAKPGGFFKPNPARKAIQQAPATESESINKPESESVAAPVSEESKKESKQFKIAEGYPEAVASLPFDGISAWQPIGSVSNGIAARAGVPSCQHGKSPALKAKIRDQLQAKHSRYLQARAGPDEMTAYWTAMMDADPDVAQHMLDAVDGRMRGEGWDDMREHEDREMAA